MNQDNLEGSITVNVNDREMVVPANTTILQSLKQAGVEIPSLCNDVRLKRSNGSCGLCVVEVGTSQQPDDAPRDVKACLTPITDGMVIKTHTDRLEEYRKVRLEQLLCDHNADCVAPCVQTCPDNIDIQTYLQHVADGNFEAAIRVIKDRNPFPSACGRVCPHPCEAACRRNLVDEPVAINAVKRFAADWDMARDQPWRPYLADATGKRVAIVGGGPSGLTAANYLAINGHEVTVFEAQPEAGGMMRYGIPEYRLPKVTLDAEIALIEALGVTINCNKKLGTHLSLETLKRDFDAVYLAIGSWRPTPMGIDGDNAKGVELGIDYLRHVTKGNDAPTGDRVIVIGGGNTAIDCARTALRKGASSVKLVYRRTQEEMPAQAIEVHEALKEGVEMVFLAAPQRITVDDAGVKSLHCLRMELGEPDRSGRRRPVPVEGSDFSIEADTIIGAIGQNTDTGFLYNDLPVRLNKWGDVDINGFTMQTSEPKIFSGGDCVTGPATVIQAIAAGRRAAAAIDEFVTNGYIKPTHEDYACSRGTLEDLPQAEFEAYDFVGRATMSELEVEARLTGFPEVELGLSEEQARAEAARCLTCGCSAQNRCLLRSEASDHQVVFAPTLHVRPRTPIVRDHPFIIRDQNKCISCGLCVAACAELMGPGVLAFQFREGLLRVCTSDGQPLNMTDCVSCGQCVRACPTGALDYERERGGVFKAINDPSKVVVGFVAPAVRAHIAKEYGLSHSEAAPFIAGMMRRIGFDKVFDFVFAADLTIMEETTELFGRLQGDAPMPLYTSCCPGWVNYAERRYPQMIPHLSSCKSPQQMMGATVKKHFAAREGISLDDLYTVSIVPCMAKKFEAGRPEFAPHGVRDVDAVITTTEFLEMAQMLRLDKADIEPDEFDEPYKQVAGAGVLFGASGGVAEAATRMAVEKLTGKPLRERLDFVPVEGFQGVKVATVEAPGRTLRIAAISGLGNADPVIKRLIAGDDMGFDLVEIMACPGGCINGAGHPKPLHQGEEGLRSMVLSNIDADAALKDSHNNPDILRLYEDFYGEPNSHLAHELLHTSYKPFRPDALASLGSGAGGVAGGAGAAAPQTLLAQGNVGGECCGGNC